MTRIHSIRCRLIRPKWSRLLYWHTDRYEEGNVYRWWLGPLLVRVMMRR